MSQHGEDGELFQCAVCYEDCPASSEAQMPCCYNPTSTLRYCQQCVEIICESPPGRCPTCSSPIQMSSNGVVTSSERQDPCRMCGQTRTIVDDQRMICECCMLGLRYCFNYECDSCHRVQRIPHPMWKYQELPTAFSQDTWACHLGCQAQTHWRIIPEQAGLVPPEHCPVSWGRREEWLEAVRAQRRLRGERSALQTRSCGCLRQWRKWIVTGWFIAFVLSSGSDNQGFELLWGVEASTALLVIGFYGSVGMCTGFL